MSAKNLLEGLDISVSTQPMPVTLEVTMSHELAKVLRLALEDSAARYHNGPAHEVMRELARQLGNVC